MNLNWSSPNKSIVATCIIISMIPMIGADQEAQQPVRMHIESHGISAKAAEKTALLIVCTGDHQRLTEIAEQIGETLQSSGHIDSRCMTAHDLPRSRTDISKQFTQGNPFVLYLSMNHDEEVLHGRLYNTLDTAMLIGKQWSKRPIERLRAQAVAHDVWEALFAMPSAFLSSIAYIKRIETKRGAIHSELWMAEWNGAAPQAITRRPAIMLAPLILSKDQIIFSEFTTTNVRLMKTDGTKKVRIVLDQPGTTVGVSGPLENSIIYCKSGVIWRYTFNEEHHQSLHEPIIHEKDPCACPVLLNNGDILYCTQGSIKRWSAATQTRSILLSGSGCTAPTACEHANLVVYARRIQGTLQLFSANLSDGTGAVQLTYGAGDKVDPALSPCGTFVVYCHVLGKTSRIYILNTLTKKATPITESHDYCLCPTWSA